MKPEPLPEQLAIEYGEFERVGGQQTIHANSRIVAATNINLQEEAAKGHFRFDLLDRLSFEVITLPPLRYRREDIPLLAEHFAIKMTIDMGNEFFPGFTDEAIKDLTNYPWPGNVRELKNVIERSIYKHKNPDTPIHSIKFNPFQNPFQPLKQTPTESLPKKEIPTRSVEDHFTDKNTLPFKKIVKKTEEELLKKCLEINNYNQRKCATYMQLTYNQLRGLLRKHGIK